MGVAVASLFAGGDQRPKAAEAGIFGGTSGSTGVQDKYVPLPNGEVMHYTETGPADAKPVLFVHGYLTSAFLYRNVIGEVCSPGQSQYRCLAVSLIGFGDSSCPGDGDIVSPAYEADRVTEFIDLMGLDDFVAVVHDWGGPIGTAAALRHADKMSHLVVLNTSLRFGSDGLLGPLMDFTGAINEGNLTVVEWIYPAVVGSVMQSFTSTWLPWGVRNEYKAPYRDWKEGDCRVHASLNLFGKATQSEPLYQEIEQRLLTAWAGRPARFLWGEDDLLFGPKTQIGIDAHNELAQLMPQAETVIIAGANHFMQEDRPVEIGQEIKAFLEE